MPFVCLDLPARKFIRHALKAICADMALESHYDLDDLALESAQFGGSAKDMERKATLYSAKFMRALALASLICLPGLAHEAFSDLSYVSSAPPLEVTFKIPGGHYSGAVTGGNLFLQTDISQAPLVRFSQAKSDKLYTLVMLDFDGDALGSWPDKDPPGKNSPVRHWIVGNISGELLRDRGYSESQQMTPAAGASADLADSASGAEGDSSSRADFAVLQPYRYPHIPVVSDRYGVYLFEQEKRIEFDPAPDPITSFDYRGFLSRYHLIDPVASNWFVAIYTSESPFSGKPFHGNDVSTTWHQDLGSGDLGRER
jgi:phosphatidylethanolamine-binding protein (PEBP) family uncharacterized protein